MAKRLVISPEVLILGASVGQGQGVARALRGMIEKHGQMPVVVGLTDHLGECYVEDDVPKCGRVAIDSVRFTADHSG